VYVFTGLLSQALHGGKWQRAQRASALIQELSAIMRPQAIGGRKNREAELPPQTPKPVNASPATAAKKHCQAHHTERTALEAFKWQVRTRGKPPIAIHKATPPRSASMAGRAVKPQRNRGPRSCQRCHSSPLPKGATKLTMARVAGAYVLKPACHGAESDSSTLDIGGKKSREAGAQPRGAKSATAWLFPLPRSAARLTAIGGQRRRRQRGGAYVRKAANRLAESDSAPLNVGGRKSRRAGTRPRCAKSVKLSSFAAAKKRCHAHSVCQTALQASKWQVHIC
jgi:hypothetical protein